MLSLSMNQENERMKGKGGGRQSLKYVDGDVPLCMRRNDDENKSTKKEKSSSSKASEESSSKEEKRKESKNERKDPSSSSTEKKQTIRTTNEEKEVTFVVLQKNLRSLFSSDRIDELMREVEGCTWDASITL